MPILDAVRRFVAALQKNVAYQPSAARDAADFLDRLFETVPFTPQARQRLHDSVRVQVLDPHSTAGGGSWHPELRLVRLNGAQVEAAIHELAHALWHEQRRDRGVRDGLVAAVQRLAQDEDPRWARVHTLAGQYVRGIPTQPGFERGLLLPRAEWGRGGGPQGEWNDAEMFAGLASGCMADIRLLPPYVRPFYASTFQELPAGALMTGPATSLR
jgi:hypothetical protein